MFAIITKWKKTGLTPSDFSKQYDISLRSFYYWRRKFNLETVNADKTDKKNDAVNFIELNTSLLNQSVERKVQIEMELPNGIRIKIY